MKKLNNKPRLHGDVILRDRGTARSPIVDAYIRAATQTQELFGDLFGSVASGLIHWAHRFFS